MSDLEEEEGGVPAALWGELFGEELPPVAQHILAEDILAVNGAEVVEATAYTTGR